MIGETACRDGFWAGASQFSNEVRVDNTRYKKVIISHIMIAE